MSSKKHAETGKRIDSFGYAALKEGGTLEPFRFKRRQLGPKDILIDIEYCGICHSDIHEVKGEWGRSRYPIVPGHEIVGRVSKVGLAVKKFSVGEKAGVGCMVGSCGKCEACKAGEEYDCAKGPVWTYGSDEKSIGGRTYGGYSNNIVVDEGFVLKISNKVDMASTAPLLCAGTTTYSPLKYWKAGPGQKVGVVGLGGLGHVAVKLASAMGADVTVFTTSKNKVKDALRLGAKRAIVVSDKKAMATAIRSFDLIVDTASAVHDVDLFLSLLRRNGKMALVGLPSKPLSVAPFSLVSGHHVLAGSGLGGIRDTQEMLDFCAKKGISADIELIPVQKVNEAYGRVVKGDVKYRFVIDMSTF